MDLPQNLTQLGLSRYEISAYLALVGHHPINGSQLSRISGVPRARIYDVLRILTDKGFVVEAGDGMYVPLPPEEFIKRLRHTFSSVLDILEEKIEAAATTTSYDYVWTIRGYDKVMDKAREMIGSAQKEIYTRLYPSEGNILSRHLEKAHQDRVSVKYISMGPCPVTVDLQVVHPEPDQIEADHGGRTFDLVVDKKELLVGLFEKGKSDRSPINWAKNHWFVITIRDSLRHDFYHYILHTLYRKKGLLTKRERALYEKITRDL